MANWLFGLWLAFMAALIASAISAAAANEHPGWLMVSWAATGVLGLAFVGLAAVWSAMIVHRFFRAVEVVNGQWYFRYWPLERIAQVYSVPVSMRDGVGPVKVSCQAQFGDDEVKFLRMIPDGNRGTIVIEFDQQKVDFASDPKEGDTAWLVVRAEPHWWRGRPSQRIQRIAIGITDHRPGP